MATKLNIAEILKDCPTGMELNCMMWDDCTFIGVETNEGGGFIIRIKTPSGVKFLDRYGRYVPTDGAKCVIFPKGKDSWEGFTVPVSSFKDGDVISNGVCVGIYNGEDNYGYYGIYAGLGSKDCSEHFVSSTLSCYFAKKNARLATEDEKALLFKAIKDHGYLWKDEYKTLEKMPSLGEGEIAFVETIQGRQWVFIKRVASAIIPRTTAFFAAVQINSPERVLHKSDFICTDYYIKDIRSATKEEAELLFDAIKTAGLYWDAKAKKLESPAPKFKPGDKLRHKELNPNYIHEIEEVHDGYYSVYGSTWKIYFEFQDNYEPAPEKFDIAQLKPFDKVLVRDGHPDRWIPALFGRRLDGLSRDFVTSAGIVHQCVPYEGNERLLGTDEDCCVPYEGNERLLGTDEDCCIPYEGNERLLGTDEDCDFCFKNWTDEI